jgi:hypothetical protein
MTKGRDSLGKVRKRLCMARNISAERDEMELD